VDLDEILYRGYAIEGDLDVVMFNPIASTILKQSRLKVHMWMQYLHQSALLNSGLG
jgi:hypothetical protein